MLMPDQCPRGGVLDAEWLVWDAYLRRGRMHTYLHAYLCTRLFRSYPPFASCVNLHVARVILLPR